MKLIAFGGIMCSPKELIKDGDFRIKGVINRFSDCPELVRYEYFACKEERDAKYNLLVNLLKEDK